MALRRLFRQKPGKPAWEKGSGWCLLTRQCGILRHPARLPLIPWPVIQGRARPRHRPPPDGSIAAQILPSLGGHPRQKLTGAEALECCRDQGDVCPAAC